MAPYKFSMMMMMTIMMIQYINVLYIRSVQNTLAAGFFSFSGPAVQLASSDSPVHCRRPAQTFTT